VPSKTSVTRIRQFVLSETSAAIIRQLCLLKHL
jgi:hypothetical protein